MGLPKPLFSADLIPTFFRDIKLLLWHEKLKLTTVVRPVLCQTEGLVFFLHTSSLLEATKRLSVVLPQPTPRRRHPLAPCPWTGAPTWLITP